MNYTPSWSYFRSVITGERIALLLQCLYDCSLYVIIALFSRAPLSLLSLSSFFYRASWCLNCRFERLHWLEDARSLSSGARARELEIVSLSHLWCSFLANDTHSLAHNTAATFQITLHDSAD